jgi:tetratricopeptide (TPR) repeat protein
MTGQSARRVSSVRQAIAGWIKSIIALIIVSLLFLSCMVKQQIKGEYYLDSHNPKAGIEFFEAELRKNPEDFRAHYYLGRLKLAADKAPEALFHMQKVCALNPQSADYHFWLAVAYSANHAPDREKESYQKVLALEPNHPGALINLGHNRFEKGELSPALEFYSRGLKGKVNDEQALFNRALILTRLQRAPEAIDAWKAYLSAYPSSPLASEAVDYLNGMGDFEFWNYCIGRKRIPGRVIGFKPFSTDLDDPSAAMLKDLGQHLASEKNSIGHVVVYQKNNKALAKAKAIEIRQRLLSKSGGMDPNNLTASWFAESKIVSTGKSSHVLHYVAIIFSEPKIR